MGSAASTADHNHRDPPMSSPRRRGPITTGLRRDARSKLRSAQEHLPVVMGPGLRRDDVGREWTHFCVLAARMRPSYSNDLPSKRRGRREGRVPTAPMVRVQQKARGRTTGESGSSGLPCAMALRLIRDLPGDHAFLPPSSADRSTNLTPASERQNHTTSPSAHTPLVAQELRPAMCVHRIPCPTSVTIASRPLCPESLAECANGRLRTNRPLLELSPLRPKGDRAWTRARDSSGGSSSTRTVARAPSPNRARKGVDDDTKRSRCRRH
jgi:hypothetical protein